MKELSSLIHLAYLPSQRRPKTPTPSATTRHLEHPMLELQRTIGNQGVHRMIQAKLATGSPDNEYERAAERASKQVVASSFPPVLQRKCACGGIANPEAECAECRNKRLSLEQHPAKHGGPTFVPPIVHKVLRSPGQPLETATQAFMNLRLDHDFAAVHVHTGADAEKSARAMGALAYTVGQNVVFGTGQYMPGTITGRRLIGHELVHTTMQQSPSQPERKRR